MVSGLSLVTVLRSYECELSAEGSYPCGCDGGYDTDEGGVRCEGGHGEGVGGGGQLEGLAGAHHRHVDNIADDDPINLVGRRQAPGHGGRARGSGLGHEVGGRSTWGCGTRYNCFACIKSTIISKMHKQ